MSNKKQSAENEVLNRNLIKYLLYLQYTIILCRKNRNFRNFFAGLQYFKTPKKAFLY